MDLYPKLASLSRSPDSSSGRVRGLLDGLRDREKAAVEGEMSKYRKSPLSSARYQIAPPGDEHFAPPQQEIAFDDMSVPSPVDIHEGGMHLMQPVPGGMRYDELDGQWYRMSKPKQKPGAYVGSFNGRG